MLKRFFSAFLPEKRLAKRHKKLKRYAINKVKELREAQAENEKLKALLLGVKCERCKGLYANAPRAVPSLCFYDDRVSAFSAIKPTPVPSAGKKVTKC